MTTNKLPPMVTVAECLDTLDDPMFSKCRSQVFQNLHNILQDKDHRQQPTSQEALRILNIIDSTCKQDIKSIPHVLNAVLSLLSITKPALDIPAKDLLRSATELLQLMKTLSGPSTQHLRAMTISTLLSYPVDVLTLIVKNNCSDFLGIFVDFTPQVLQGVSKSFHISLSNLLTTLPPEEKKRLLKEGLPQWFKLISTIMDASSKTNDEEVIACYIQSLEVLTDALVEIDYFQSLYWQNDILKHICDTKIYPAIFKELLLSHSAHWHRYWIVFVKLLKHQITRSSVYGTPIQPMLEVVETAFKMSPEKRCRAFQCWEVLINVLSSDTNPKSVPRYLKLLLIPMKLNNAKTEDTARAKFYTWWTLVTKFQTKLGQFTNDVLFEFLGFMFGKKGTSNNSGTGVGTIYDNLKCMCLEAFAEIVGHDNKCDCSTDLPRLNGKMLTTKLLASNWNDWMCALKAAINMTNSILLRRQGNINATHQTQLQNEPMHVICVWTAFVISIAELPPNGVRKDMFSELVQVLIDLLQISETTDALPDIIFSLALCLTEYTKKVTNLLASKGEDQPIQKIMAIITNPKMAGVFNRYETLKMLELLKPFTQSAVTNLGVNSCIFTLLENNCFHKLWTAFAHFLNETNQNVDIEILRKMLLWPIRNKEDIEMDEFTIATWKILFDIYANKNEKRPTDDFCFEVLANTNDYQSTFSYFELNVALSILKIGLLSKIEGFEVYSNMLNMINATVKFGFDYKKYEKLVPMLVDTLVVMLDGLTNSVSKNHATVSLDVAKSTVLMIFTEITFQETCGSVDANLYNMLDNIFTAIQPLCKVTMHIQILSSFFDAMKEYAKPLQKDSSLIKYLILKLNYLKLDCPHEMIKTKVNELIEAITDIPDKKEKNTDCDTNKLVKPFTSPNPNKVIKRTKKKETVILNTVTENGEEYAVIKSNWKFNPKKLTEHQKEKLQGKRVDIALYQDLSQSQDEFKLSKWKTDSQDTTTSSNSKSSKLTTSENATNILKNIETPDVVPNIMKNILSESVKNHRNGLNEKKLEIINKSEKAVQTIVSTPKSVRSPRMALKDRLFRNLTAKASPKNEKSDLNIDESKQNRTPAAKITNNSNIINSAPSQICQDRPSRVKRAPKKFADVHVFGLKKRRYSLSDSQSNPENEMEISENANEGGNEKSNTDLCVDLEAEKVAAVPEELLCNAQNKEETSDTQENSNILSTSDNNNKHDERHLEEETNNNDDSQTLLKSDPISSMPTKDVAPVNANEEKIENNDVCEVQDVQVNEIVHNNQTNELKDQVTNTKDSVELGNEPINKETVAMVTPVGKNKETSQKSTTKKNTPRKSRIEKELAIDMVESLLLTVQSEKRLTRRKRMETEVSKRQSTTEKLNTKAPAKRSPKDNKKCKKEHASPNTSDSSGITVDETQEKDSQESETVTEDAPYSEDVIESSQDSNFTAVTVKSTIRTPTRQPVVSIEKLQDLAITGTQELLQESDCDMLCEINKSRNHETNEDIELPQNKTAEVDKNQSELTENMDTEPVISEKLVDDDVIIINDDRDSPNHIQDVKSMDTQELAEADTQANDPSDFIDLESQDISPACVEIQNTPMDITESMSPSKLVLTNSPITNIIEISTEPVDDDKDTDICSPFKDDAQRKQDFLNNTSEISPIKIQSPDKDKTSPEKNKETSSDYLIVKLSSPVHSNGEPFTSKGSPEFFTEDKTSPDKRDQSPPRAEIVVTNSSPSSSLSLKKNRPQSLRPGGRAAQMIGLCVPDSVNSKKKPDKPEHEESKKSNTSTPVRKNLRLLYNAESDNSDISEENEQDNFLKLKKALPPIHSSPAVPILKRKLDVVDDTTGSPASKRKRVSFLDPPVSTTVSVQKYIRLDCVEPPSYKPLTRSAIKSPKKVDNPISLDTELSKVIKDFTEQPDSLTIDASTSLDVTPAVEIVITSELNDTDPIYPDLIDCKDSLETIAVELTSPAMKDFFIKELDGKVLTVGDLAKMSELEVNRLCIKAPKVQVVKKALANYFNNRATVVEIPTVIVIDDETAISTEMQEEMIESVALDSVAVETQTNNISTCETMSQTNAKDEKLASTQTTSVSMMDVDIQTTESSFRTTSEIITSCLIEREDFVKKLGEELSSDTISEMLIDKSDDSTSKELLTRLMDCKGRNLPNEERNIQELAVLKDILLERFHHNDLVLFCSRLLQGLHDKTT